MVKCKSYYLDWRDISNKIEEYYNNYEVIDIKIIPHVTNTFYLFFIYKGWEL